MSGRRLHLSLFVSLFLLFPLPFLLMEWGLAPALRIVMLTGILSAITIEDGFSELSKIMLPIIAVQAIAYPALLYWGSGRALRAMGGRDARGASIGLVVAVTVLLLILASFDVYVTPVSSASRQSSLVQILE